MSRSDPAVVWPAPGLPAFLEPPAVRLEVIVAVPHAGAHVLRQWSERIALSDALEHETIPLTLAALGPAAPALVAERAGQFAALPEAAGCSFFVAQLAAPRCLAADGPRTVRLFDLVADGSVVRPRSVAVFREHSAILKLAFACDLHLAAQWDELASAVDRHAPAFAERVHRPRRLLDQFIGEVNAMAASGDLDLVVLGGDLVDHVYSEPRRRQGHGPRATNVGLLLEALMRLEVPTLTIPGNHDHRAFPWRPRVWGLEEVGIDGKEGETVLRKAGLWDRWPIRRQDLDSLRTSNHEGKPALGDYLARIAPATDYRCALRGLNLLCLSTGPDIIGRWRHVECARWGLFLRDLRSTVPPNSEGFSDAQLAHTRRWLGNGPPSAVFFHAPLLASKASRPVEHRLGRFEVERQDLPSARVRFERRLQRADLRRGVAFRNSGPLIQELVSPARGGVVTFSGHVHRAGGIEVNRRTLCVRSVDPDQAIARPETVTLLTAPSLTQLRTGGNGGPGYFRARFEAGALVSLEQRRFSSVN
jgi:hypothetical protein